MWVGFNGVFTNFLSFIKFQLVIFSENYQVMFPKKFLSSLKTNWQSSSLCYKKFPLLFSSSYFSKEINIISFLLIFWYLYSKKFKKYRDCAKRNFFQIYLNRLFRTLEIFCLIYLFTIFLSLSNFCNMIIFLIISVVYVMWL